jgi:LysM repeat protein
MSDDRLGKVSSSLSRHDPLLDFPGQDVKPSIQDHEQNINSFEIFWEGVTQFGWTEPAVRIGTILLSIILAMLVIWVMRSYFAAFNIQDLQRGNEAAFAADAANPTPKPEVDAPILPIFSPDTNSFSSLFRMTSLNTSIPTRPRINVITYTVSPGDSVFGIADMFSLKPETIMWANTNILADNPHRLQVGQVINILPVNGTYHKWSAGEDLVKVAEFYKVDVEDITNFPGNPFDPFDFDILNPDIQPGTMLIIPGGQREMIDYGPPRIPRDNPAVARTYGPGHCGVLVDGIIGDGIFIWPTAEHWLSGYDFSPSTNHYGIDIAGQTGNPIWAVDDGVVVYSGWSNSGYGNLIVIDHGNDWQSLYAHLDIVYVSCGESVYQGTTIGSMGSTGNSSGSHLHFELLYGSVKVNPWNFLP